MSSTSTTQSDAQLVGAGYEAFAAGDFAALDRLFHANATWNHRNNDRYGGVHSGKDAIFAFFAGSAQDAAGTLRVEPQSVIADGSGLVAVVVRMTGARPDGRTLEDTQVHLFRLDGGAVTSVEQFVGAPEAVTSFWA